MATELKDHRAALIDFGSRLRSARRTRGYDSLTDFADLMHVSKQAVTLWERGKRLPDYETVWRLEVLLRVAPGTFTALTHPEHEQRPPVDPEQAILAASDLTVAQREGLLGVLRAYRGTPERPE